MTDRQRYEAALQAMQAGVAIDEGNNKPNVVSHKHLRVGINAAMSDQAGLVRLLIDKGLITEQEYVRALADEMEREKARYEERLSAEHGGVKITLA